MSNSKKIEKTTQASTVKNVKPSRVKKFPVAGYKTMAVAIALDLRFRRA